MREEARSREADPRQEEMTRIGGALHDMCQPLTAILCLLEMAEMEPDGDAVRGLVSMALKESERLRRTMMTMHDMMRAAKALEE